MTDDLLDQLLSLANDRDWLRSLQQQQTPPPPAPTPAPAAPPSTDEVNEAARRYLRAVAKQQRGAE